MTRQERAETRWEEIKDVAVMVPGGKTWFYIYSMDGKYGEKWGMFFPSTGMDLWFTGQQASVLVEFFKQNKLAE